MISFHSWWNSASVPLFVANNCCLANDIQYFCWHWRFWLYSFLYFIQWRRTKMESCWLWRRIGWYLSRIRTRMLLYLWFFWYVFIAEHNGYRIIPYRTCTLLHKSIVLKSQVNYVFEHELHSLHNSLTNTIWVNLNYRCAGLCISREKHEYIT